MRWLAAAHRASQIEGAARVTVMADRAAGIFALFAPDLTVGGGRPMWA